jgi:acyl-CoA reductase-like NAD-dependent aldehyde dehydrogenase
VLLGVVGRRRARHEDRAAVPHRRHLFNNHNATAVDERAPLGGFNASGIGRELRREGMHEFTETRVMAMPSER